MLRATGLGKTFEELIILYHGIFCKVLTGGRENFSTGGHFSNKKVEKKQPLNGSWTFNSVNRIAWPKKWTQLLKFSKRKKEYARMRGKEGASIHQLVKYLVQRPFIHELCGLLERAALEPPRCFINADIHERFSKICQTFSIRLHVGRFQDF